MKKNRKFYIVLCLLIALFGLTLSGCSQSSGSSAPKNVKIVDFKVNEFTTAVDIGTKYDLGKTIAKDDYDNYYVAEVSVKDPDGIDVEVEVNTSGKKSFLCDKFGVYTITYTINYNDNDSISKTSTIEVIDISEPKVITDFYEHNITTVGDIISLNDFVVSDNSGDEIEYVTNIYFNGTLDNSLISNDELELNQKGCYTIEIIASDSNENEMIKEFNIYTLMDFESKKFAGNSTYSSSITKDAAYDGDCSYEFGAFNNFYSYFNDYSMLGCIKILDDSTNYVSFWVKFENPNYSNILKAQYHETIIYDQFGDLLPKYPVVYEDGSTYDGYELYGNRWYKVVVDLTNVVNLGETEDVAGVTANPTSLDLVPFYWGVWDSANNTNASTSQYVFIDNVMLTNDPETGVKPAEKLDYEFPKNCIADFETPEQLDAFVSSWNTKISLTDEVSPENVALKFVPYSEWSSFGIKGLLGVDELSSFNSITAKVYVKDESESNLYDEETNLVVALRYFEDDSTYTEVATAVIKTNGEWINIELPLGDYNQYSLSGRDFDICIFKTVEGTPVPTGEYNNLVSVYIDDIYVK